MQINKVVYFLHADFLVTFSRPLVSAKIEAWTHGPVFRELYREFKAFGEDEITGRVFVMSAATGKRGLATCQFRDDERSFLESAARKYSAMSASALRAQSHVEGGPWDLVWNHDTETNASMKITDELIKHWYERTAKH